MDFIIRVYCENRIHGIDLSMYKEASIGSGNDTLKVNVSGLKSNHITFKQKSGDWIMKGKLLHMFKGKSDTPISSSKIEDGNKYYINTNPVIYITIHPKNEDSIYALDLKGLKKVIIGRKSTYSENSIIMKDRRTSGEHCAIYKYNDNYYIKDLESTNGTFVNNVRISSERKLLNEDIINISVYQIRLKKEVLFFYNTGNEIVFNVPKQNIIDATKAKGMLSGDEEGTVSEIPDFQDGIKNNVKSLDENDIENLEKNYRFDTSEDEGSIDIFK